MSEEQIKLSILGILPQYASNIDGLELIYQWVIGNKNETDN